MVFKNQKSASFRVTLIIALIVAMYGLFPVGANAQTSIESASEAKNCYPGSGWMWTPGPSKPELASKVQKELAQQGIHARVEARGYGETDNCDAYVSHGVDFSLQMADKQSKQVASQTELNDAILSILNKHGKSDLGTVKLFSSNGELIANNINNQSSTSEKIAMDAFPAQVLSGDPITKNVYVIVYDPLLANGQKLSQRLGWNDHATITQQTVNFFKQTTNNRMNYVVVETTVVTSGWPELVDGFRYTEEEYFAVLSNPQLAHDPEQVDYNRILTSPQFDICGKVNRGEIHELWIYNGSYFGFSESTLAGPGAYEFNSAPVASANNCNRILPIMGPVPERTAHEAIHNFGHRAEATMAKVYGSWQQNNTSHNWNKFGLVKIQSPNYSYSGCGSIHFPPNGTFQDGDGYDYDNPDDVLSNCDDFLNYPNLSDPLQVAQPVNCTRWGCDQLGYLQYWFGHLPAFTGCGPDNVANDWWRYVSNPGAALYPANACQPDMRTISGNVGAPGAVLSYTDGTAKTVTTDASGNYFLMVSNHWSGTVTPSRLGFTFIPASKTYTDVTTDLYNQDYAFDGGLPLTFYVNTATGDNNNTCISVGAPCRDIQEAINKAVAGDTIKVANGRYLLSSNSTPNVVIFDKSLTLSGGWTADFTSQTGASTIDGANANNGILIISGTVTVENFIVENSTSSNSGAIYIVNGSLSLKRSTLRNNIATNNGAGIFVDNGTVNVINSTISGNRANGVGGGIYASNNGSASVTIQNSTIVYNQASRGGGISRANGTYNIINTIIANNSSLTSGPDCDGTVATASFNIIESISGCSITNGNSNLNVDPQIDNNLTGDMLVHMLFAGSPAVDAATVSGCPLTDQQGTSRPQGSSCDIGAYEVEIPNSAPTDINLSPSSVNENQPAGTTVGTLSTSDPDVWNSHTYAFCGGANVASFSISGNQLKTATVFDYETKTSYSVCIRSTDNGHLSTTKTFVISVNDLMDTQTFNDVASGYWAWNFIERLYNAGITGGCGNNNYCPESAVTRAQMAIFLLRGIHGSSYSPPGVGGGTGFGDVSTNHWAAAWIKQLAAEGITGGCGGGNFCPGAPVTRDQMAVFLLKAKYGTSYSPPAVGGGTGFTDVSANYWAAAWIKQLAAESITGGCGQGNYCPETAVNRAQMAVFLVKTFNLP